MYRWTAYGGQLGFVSFRIPALLIALIAKLLYCTAHEDKQYSRLGMVPFCFSLLFMFRRAS